MKTRGRLACASCALVALVILAGCGHKSAAPPKTSPRSSTQRKNAPTTQTASPTVEKAAPKVETATAASSPGASELAKALGLPASPSPGELAPSGGAASPTTLSAPASGQRPQAAQLLLAMQSVYRTIVTMRIEGVSDTITRQDGKVVGKVTGEKSTMELKRPNKFLILSPEGRTYCNGRVAYNYSPSAKQYAKIAKPDLILRTIVSRRIGIGMIGLALGMDYTRDFSSLTLLGDKNTGGREMFVLAAKLRPGVSIPRDTEATQTLWIGKKDLGIYRNEVVLKMRPKPPKGYKGKLPKLIETRMVDVISSFWTNIKLPDSGFEFKPPAGAKPVEIPKQVRLNAKPAPDFSFKWTDGSPRKLSDFRGGIVVLSFSVLPQCEAHLPILQSICNENKSSVQVISVNLNRDTAGVDKYLKKKGYSVPTVYADARIVKAATQEYGLRTIPTLLIIDSKGVVRDEIAGFTTRKEVESALAKVK